MHNGVTRAPGPSPGRRHQLKLKSTESVSPRSRHLGWRRLASDRGQGLIETAITIPIVLLVCIAIFEFGRAYQTQLVLTNAAREGARIAILPNSTTAGVQARVTAFLTSGQLANAATARVDVNQNIDIPIGVGTAKASLVTVSYPFSFVVLNPVARLVTRGTNLGGAPITLSASAQMRNEAE